MEVRKASFKWFPRAHAQTGTHAHTPTTHPPRATPTLVQYYTQCVLFISTSGHFFLIRHLPASGVFIIYREVITYTRLQGSHPAHGLLLQKRLHATGPVGFTLETIDFHQSWRTWSLQSAGRSASARSKILFLAAAVFIHLSCQTSTCVPWRVPDCLTTEEQIRVLQTDLSLCRGFGFKRHSIWQM